MEKNSTYATAYLPKIFFDRLSKDVFTGTNQLVANRVSYAWLVRFYRLFEAVSDWMSLNKGKDMDAPSLIAAWSSSAEINNMPFSSDTGRMTGARSLRFLLLIDKSMNANELEVVYSAISKVLKRWDEWYLNAIGNQVQSAISTVSGLIPADYARILVSTNYYKYGDDPSKLFDKYSHPTIPDVYELSYMSNRDKDFEPIRIKPVQALSTTQTSVTAPIAPKTGEGLTIDGPLDLAKLEAFRAAKSKGENVTIKSFVGDGSVLNKAQQLDEENKMKAVNNEVSKTPIIDWFLQQTEKEQNK